MITQASRQLFLSLDGGTALPVIATEVTGPEYNYIRSATAVLPDPEWAAVDRNGHNHRWVLTGRDDAHKTEALPTLQRRRERVPCDGSCGNWDCDGWTRWAYNCRQCGALIEPGYIPDHEARTRGIPILVEEARYRFQVEGFPFANGTWRSDTAPMRGELSDGRGARTGKAWFTGEIQYESDRAPVMWVEVQFDDTDPHT